MITNCSGQKSSCGSALFTANPAEEDGRLFSVIKRQTNKMSRLIHCPLGTSFRIFFEKMLIPGPQPLVPSPRFGKLLNPTTLDTLFHEEHSLFMNSPEPGLKKTFTRLMESPTGEVLVRVGDFLAAQGIEAYLVGGLVRDVLLGRETADIDLAVSADALDVAAKVAAALDGRYVLLDRENRIGRVVLADAWELDFSTFDGSIEQDLARRDFTCNAMAVNLHQLLKGTTDIRLIDPFKGWDDLRRGVIRAVTEDVFTADAARLLRAVRLAAELGFKIDGPTEALIQRDASLIAAVAGERVREELLRLLAVADSGQSLSHLDKLGLLTIIFPELALTKGVAQPKEHFWDVFEHSLKTVAAVDFLLRQGRWEYNGEQVLAAVPWPAAVVQHFTEEVSHGSTRRSLLKLAGLLHDIAKPQTKAIEADGKMRFLRHAPDGASIVADMLERLRFSTKEIKLVETEVKHHMRPTQMSQEGMPTRRAIYRYFRDTGDAEIDILYLSLADHLAARGPSLDPDGWREHTRVVEYVLVQRFEQESIAHPPKLVDGNDLIDIFGLTPGPELGRILEAVRETQAEGEIKTRQDALDYIRRKLGKGE